LPNLIEIGADSLLDFVDYQKCYLLLNFKKNQLFSTRFQPFSFSSVFIIKPPKLRKNFYNQSDQVLVDKCLSGDAQAQQELYEKYVQAMYNVSVRSRFFGI